MFNRATIYIILMKLESILWLYFFLFLIVSILRLFLSGSTGKPKGVLHTTGGYMLYAATTFKYVFPQWN